MNEQPKDPSYTVQLPLPTQEWNGVVYYQMSLPTFEAFFQCPRYAILAKVSEDN